MALMPGGIELADKPGKDLRSAPIQS